MKINTNMFPQAAVMLGADTSLNMDGINCKPLPLASNLIRQMLQVFGY